MDAPSQTREADTTPRGARALVFVIDADDAVRDSLELLLHSEGFDAVGFPSSKAALGSLETARPDCVVLDVAPATLPDLETLRSLAARGRLAPTVLTASRLGGLVRQHAQALGSTAVLAKPLHIPELISAIRRATAATAAEPR